MARLKRHASLAAAGSSGFEFLDGFWSVKQRKLKHRLEGDGAWSEFGGTITAQPIRAGQGNFDENVLEDPSGAYEACTIRTFDPDIGRWSIVGIDGRDHPTGPAPRWEQALSDERGAT